MYLSIYFWWLKVIRLSTGCFERHLTRGGQLFGFGTGVLILIISLKAELYFWYKVYHVTWSYHHFEILTTKSREIP